MFKECFKNFHFGSNEIYPKFTLLVNFGAQFTHRKPKTFVKTQISPKSASLGLSNNINTKPQKDHKILVKLIKKQFLGPKWV